MTVARSEAVVIGASAGAFDALTAILPLLPDGYRLPIMIVVHMPMDKKSVLAELFQRTCKIAVREAEDKEPIESATAYFAPPDYHLLVERTGSLALSSDKPILYSRPSIDALFESAADAYGAGLVGIVLTGANSDGAIGLKAVLQAGGTAIVQDPLQAYASAMPEAALATNTGAMKLSLNEIAEYLQKVGRA
jgi:two-component system chemotaxis response regulator CheB